MADDIRVRFHGGPLDGRLDEVHGQPMAWCEIVHEPAEFPDEFKEPAESVARLRERLDEEIRRIGTPDPDSHVSLYWLEHRVDEPVLDGDGCYRYLFLGTDRRIAD